MRAAALAVAATVALVGIWDSLSATETALGVTGTGLLLGAAAAFVLLVATARVSLADDTLRLVNVFTVNT